MTVTCRDEGTCPAGWLAGDDAVAAQKCGDDVRLPQVADDHGPLIEIARILHDEHRREKHALVRFRLVGVPYLHDDLVGVVTACNVVDVFEYGLGVFGPAADVEPQQDLGAIARAPRGLQG